MSGYDRAVHDVNATRATLDAVVALVHAHGSEALRRATDDAVSALYDPTDVVEVDGEPVDDDDAEEVAAEEVAAEEVAAVHAAAP